MPCYSLFWLDFATGRRRLSAIWRDRPDPDLTPLAGSDGALAHPAEQLDMGAWLRLPEQEREAIVQVYASVESCPQDATLSARCMSANREGRHRG